MGGERVGRISKWGWICLWLWALTGCSNVPLRDITDAPIESTGGLTLDDVERTIVRAGKRSGWTVKPLQPGLMEAEFRDRGGKHGAVVNIRYDASTYHILYSSSTNLKYRPNATGFDASTYFGGEPAPEQGPTIHKVYQQRLDALDRAIRAEFKFIAEGGLPEEGALTEASADGGGDCDPRAEFTSASRGVVNVARANVRAGAGTHCARVGGLSRGEAVEILGRKGDWYQISAPSTGRAWILGRLLKVAREQTAAPPRSLHRPSPAAASDRQEEASAAGRKISIAVIRFKTLNREAQEAALGDLLTDRFTTALVNSRSFDIVERRQLNRVVKEIERSRTGFIDTSQEVEVGRRLGADAVITGSVVLLSSGKIQVNARTITVENAYVISADSKIRPYNLEGVDAMVEEMVRNLAEKLTQPR